MFKNYKAVVTGGTGALGTDVCQMLLLGGAEVHATYIVDEELERLPDKIVNHPNFKAHSVSLTNESQVTRFFDELGTIDALCSMAGGFQMGATQNTELDAWQQMFDINLTTTFLSCRQALRRMDARRGGRIIAVGSHAVIQPAGGLAAYRASKAALLNLIQSIAEETLDTQITANAVLPTVLDTPANRQAMPDADYAKWVTTKQVAGTIEYLLQPTSTHITGALIPLRGHV